LKKPRYQKHLISLSKRHHRLKKLINLIGPIKNEVPLWNNINDAILYAVIGQMLSVSAANSIIKRLITKFGSAHSVITWAKHNSDKPGPIWGVSERKRRALSEWATFVDKNGRRWNHWPQMPLEQFRKELTSIWGFGNWASDMIAIFYLGRMDVWPESDTGILKASKIVFKTSNKDKILKHINGSETVVAIYLWELLNRKLYKSFNKNG
jgi:3-methyladenine DNA glycosylase/8-oxoguanine DNA glycosylase